MSSVEPNSIEDSAGAETQQVDTRPAETQPSINPIYAQAFEYANVPPEFRGKLTEKFQEWDRNHQQQLSKWEPYKEFAGVDPQELRQSRSVWDAISTDPVGVWQRMGDNLRQQGLIEAAREQEAQRNQTQTQQETLSQNYSDDTQDRQPVSAQVPPELDERFAKYEQFMQWQLNQAQQQEEARKQQELENQIVADMNAVMSKWGTGNQELDQQFAAQVIERLANANASGRPISPEQAAQQIQTYNDQVIADFVQNRRIAPRMVPANGGIPEEVKINPEHTTAAQRKALGEWIANGKQGIPQF
jgi:hypothetical protein